MRALWVTHIQFFIFPIITFHNWQWNEGAFLQFVIICGRQRLSPIYHDPCLPVDLTLHLYLNRWIQIPCDRATNPWKMHGEDARRSRELHYRMANDAVRHATGASSVEGTFVIPVTWTTLFTYVRLPSDSWHDSLLQLNREPYKEVERAAKAQLDED